MFSLKWVKLRELRKLYSVCNCSGCNTPRNLDMDPSVCPDCGSEDFYTDQYAAYDLLRQRTKNLVCCCCPTSLLDEKIDMYPSDVGWKMPGVLGKWWMSIGCPHCGYNNSFDKFGILRN